MTGSAAQRWTLVESRRGGARQLGMGGERIARKPGGCSGPLYKANSNKKAASLKKKWGAKKKKKKLQLHPCEHPRKITKIFRFDVLHKNLCCSVTEALWVER